jgi:YfiH family protein
VTFDRRGLPDGGHVLVSTALESDGFLAAFSERSGGKSEAPYDSLNLSFAVGDEDERVTVNRERLCRGLGIERFATAEQVHGAKVVRVGVRRARAGFDAPADRIPRADVLTAASAGVAIAVLTADCVPVVAASGRAGTVAVAHAGWRGIAASIVAEMASVFERPADVRVAIGPAIGPDHYEVGEDVALAVAAGTQAGAVTERHGDRIRLDLVATIRAELRALGIRRVEDTGLCTACHDPRFFSYRRDEVTGRQGAIAARLRA